MSINRRDFLRMRAGERGRTLELSCRMLYMRCIDAAIPEPSVEEYEQAIGEPPPLIARRTTDEIFAMVERDLREAEVLRLVEPEWLDGLEGRARLQQIFDAFRTRGGRVERVS